jgi:hypothetical protein
MRRSSMWVATLGISLLLQLAAPFSLPSIDVAWGMVSVPPARQAAAYHPIEDRPPPPPVVERPAHPFDSDGGNVDPNDQPPSAIEWRDHGDECGYDSTACSGGTPDQTPMPATWDNSSGW